MRPGIRSGRSAAAVMMTFVTKLVRFYDHAVADEEGANPARVRGLRANTEALRKTILDVIEPAWKVEEAFGKLRDAAALYSRTTPANAAQRVERFAAFNVALAGFAETLDGPEADEVEVVSRQAFCRDHVPNPFADLA